MQSNKAQAGYLIIVCDGGCYFLWARCAGSCVERIKGGLLCHVNRDYSQEFFW